MYIYLKRRANDLHMVQLTLLPPRHLLRHWNPRWFSLSGAGLPRLSWIWGSKVGVCLSLGSSEHTVRQPLMTLVVPPTRLSTGDRTFPMAAVRTWNSLPTSLTSLSSLASFRRQLKTELFARSFPDLDSSAYDRIWLTLCSHFASHSHFVTVLAL